MRIIAKPFCGHCTHMQRQELWCYLLNSHRRLLQRPCAELVLREGLRQHCVKANDLQSLEYVKEAYRG